MCSVCGCGEAHLEDRQHIDAHDAAHAAQHAAGIPHHHHPQERLDFGAGVAGLSVPGLGQDRIIAIEQAILGKNDALALQNRAHFERSSILALNLLSSPGSGKTTLLCKTIALLRGTHTLAVIEGDQQTSLDAERIRGAGAAAVQVNTGKGCHLDAAMVAQAADVLAPAAGTILFIENVGNLVCPAAFDLGEQAKVVILSLTEGEDKPLKYPDMFAVADLLILNKIDLAPHLDFDVALCIKRARLLNPSLDIIQLSARSGEGLDLWIDWIIRRRASLPAA
jgi:hydrogenase nickel incorporation protein HypB